METEVLEVEYNYNPAFCRKDIRDQIWILVNEFGIDPKGRIDPKEALNYLNDKEKVFNQTFIGDGYKTDGLFAVLSPFWFRKILDPNEQEVFNPKLYCESLKFLFEKIGKDMAFINYKRDMFAPFLLKQTERTIEGYSKLSYFQGESDIWIINAQLGFFRKGEPANTELHSHEYGLSSAFAGCIAITHPEFFGDSFNYLSGICAGDVFLEKESPQFFSNGSLLMYNSVSIENSYPKAGIMSFFT